LIYNWKAIIQQEEEKLFNFAHFLQNNLPVFEVDMSDDFEKYIYRIQQTIDIDQLEKLINEKQKLLQDGIEYDN
jgi:hypothetical protein